MYKVIQNTKKERTNRKNAVAVKWAHGLPIGG